MSTIGRRRSGCIFTAPFPAARSEALWRRRRDGLDFTVSRRGLAAAYLRAVRWDDQWIGMDKTASLRWSPDGLTKFANSRVNNLGVPAAALRHVALELAGATGTHPPALDVYYTKVGDAPESIWRCKIDLDHGWRKRQARDHTRVLAPQTRWEGALRRTRPSKRGFVRTPERALRDPAIFTEGGSRYLVYAVAGEGGIAIAKLNR